MNKATITLSLITSAIVIAVICVIALNWSAIKTMLAGGKLYTIDDINTAYEEGKQDYAKINAKYDELLKEYQEKSMQVIELTEKVKTLENENKQIPELKRQIEELQAKVKELQNKVKYYEELLSAYENANKLIATFMYDDEIYLVQLYESGSKVSIQAPQNTEHITFESWLVDGQEVDLETYTITENTTFVAKLTYYQIVTYKDGETVLKTQRVKKADVLDTQGYVAPTKSYFNFVEWQLNGESIAKGFAVNDDIVLTAKYEYALNGQYVYYFQVVGNWLEGVFTISDTTIEDVISRKRSINDNTLITFALSDNKINATINLNGEGIRYTNVVWEPMLDSANNITELKPTVTEGDLYLNWGLCYKCDENLSQNYITIFVDGKLTKSISKSEMAQKLSANYADTYVPTITFANRDTCEINFTKVQDSYFVFIDRIDDEFGTERYCLTIAAYDVTPVTKEKTSITVQFRNATSQVIDNSVKYEYQI